ncbi:MAG TPA: hypothetical protein VF152_02035 [Acidimicrobiia bacterium]
METTLTVPPALATSKTLTEGKDAAGVLARSMLADARELAGHAGAKAQATAADLAAKGSERYGEQARKQADRLERRAERVARRLPVDTPFDERRRRRRSRRGARRTFVVVAVLGIAAVAYLAWQRRKSTVEEPAPDASGAAADAAGNGRVGREAPVG